MSYLVKEELYVLYDGTEKHTVRVEELAWGFEPWPGKFRVQIQEPNGQIMGSVYGRTSREAAQAAAERILALAARSVSPTEQIRLDSQITN